MEINGRKYLYDIVYDTLKTEILEGKLDYGVLLPSEREISIRFSVERTTVRKALQLLVDDGLVEKKAGIGTKVIFRKVGRKKESSSEHKKVIGFFMSDDAQNGFSITQPFYAQLFYSLEIECRKKDYQLMYASVNEDTNVRELLDSQDYYLIIFVSSLADQFADIVKSAHVPALLLNNACEAVGSVSYDNAEGTYRMLKYLYYMGHRDIAIISASEKYFSTKRKMEGIFRATQELGIKIRKSNIVYSGNWDYQNGYNCTRELLEGRDRKDYPTTIFAFNDFMAIGAIQALKDMSLRVPEDISVAGFDNIDMLKYMERDLTTIDTDIPLMARMILNDNVMQMARELGTGFQITTPIKLIKGSTVKRIEWKTPVINK